AVAAALRGCLFHKADIRVPEDCRTLVDKALEEWGRVDILVNNAGLQHMAPIEEFPLEKWDELIGVMLTGPFLLIRYAIPHMYANGWGRIINIASASGLVAHPFKSAYCSAKHGLVGLTKAVALEAGAKGVTVNAICPAYVSTPLMRKQIADQAELTGVSEAEVIEQNMLGPAAVKTLVRVEEVAAYVLFLCSKTSGTITGAAQLIDGGWTAR
ncbi:MAG: 3-hydroxybutyrate dehydrogenase, partial [Armatimonadetes bacterium]|nr:3-hydroxybutyrate dehydrogenase [Armatimonadota bacterium]